jgi:hypothetical protein
MRSFGCKRPSGHVQEQVLWLGKVRLDAFAEFGCAKIWFFGYAPFLQGKAFSFRSREAGLDAGFGGSKGLKANPNFCGGFGWPRFCACWPSLEEKAPSRVFELVAGILSAGCAGTERICEILVLTF